MVIWAVYTHNVSVVVLYGIYLFVTLDKHLRILSQNFHSTGEDFNIFNLLSVFLYFGTVTFLEMLTPLISAKYLKA